MNSEVAAKFYSSLGAVRSIGEVALFRTASRT